MLTFETLESRWMAAMDATGDGWLTSADVLRTIQQIDDGQPGVYPIDALHQINELNAYGPHRQASAELHRLDLPEIQVHPGQTGVLLAAWDLVLEQPDSLTTFQSQRPAGAAFGGYVVNIGETTFRLGAPSCYPTVPLPEGTSRLEIYGQIPEDAHPAVVQLGSLRVVVGDAWLEDILPQRLVEII